MLYIRLHLKSYGLMVLLLSSLCLFLWNISFIWKKFLIIQLPMQEARVPFLVREDPTCVRATKPVHHNYGTSTLEPATHSHWARTLQPLKPRCPRACALQREATTTRSPRTTTRERLARQWRPSTVINK